MMNAINLVNPMSRDARLLYWLLIMPVLVAILAFGWVGLSTLP